MYFNIEIYRQNPSRKNPNSVGDHPGIDRYNYME